MRTKAKALVVLGLVVIASASVLGSTTIHTATPHQTTQQQCEREYVAQLHSYLDGTKTPNAPHCKAMTDGQWMLINEHTDSLHTQLTESMG